MEEGESLIIDTHVHSFNPKTRNCWAKTQIDEMKKQRIRFMEIPINIDDFEDMAGVMSNFDSCMGIGVGQHPKLISAGTNVDELMEKVNHYVYEYRDKIRLIKTGLDYYRVTDETSQKKQRETLRRMLMCAQRNQLPVVLHIRSNDKEIHKADYDLMKILEEMDYKDKAVIHCYHGESFLTEEYLTLSAQIYFGIGGAITFEENQALCQAIVSMPKERILLETDAPYIKPCYPDGTRPKGKKNSPLNLPIIIEKLAEIYGMDYEEIVEQTTQNATRFYNKKRR
ncbi:MAG: TatD family hydrolase [Blautia sp.]|nr:TatD family hydrolase [Blautia sp.]